MMAKKMKDLDYFFHPRSVAIVGASQDEGSIGYVELENFVKGSFKGKVYAINPKRKAILGVKCLSSIEDVKGDVDLAIITTPSFVVPKVLKECAEKKVKGVILISAGFGEIGQEKLTAQVKKIIKDNPRMRVVGPNVLGMLYMKNGVDSLFNPPYRSPRPPVGGISFISQSGALGAAFLDWAALRNYGINKFVSFGNAMDVDEADLIEYLGEDDETSVIIVYLEGVKDGRKFFKVTRKVAQQKPIILIKGGLTKESAKSTLSHTGSLAGNVEVYKALFKQNGIVYAEDMKELFNYAKVFNNEPLPKGNRVQIITNGGGYGVLTTDAVLLNDLKLAKMQDKTRKALEKACPDYCVLGNPVDLTGDATNERYRVALESALKDDNIDAIILIILFQVPTITKELDKIVARILKDRKKPVIIMSAGGKPAQKHKAYLEQQGITTFASAGLSALTVFG